MTLSAAQAAALQRSPGVQPSASNVVPVGLGELKFGGRDVMVLTCFGLGSCVGVVLYDPVAQVGGLAHVVLPSSQAAPGADPGGRYADLAVPRLIVGVLGRGAQRNRLVCKVAGGAQILKFGSAPGMDIGARNGEAVLAALQAQQLPTAAADLGGSSGRTMELRLPECKVFVSAAGKGQREL